MIYQPNDSRSLAESLASLLRQPDKLSEHAQQGRRAVTDQFSIHNMVTNMTKVYEDVLYAWC